MTTLIASYETETSHLIELHWNGACFVTRQILPALDADDGFPTSDVAVDSGRAAEHYRHAFAHGRTYQEFPRAARRSA